MKKHWLHRVLCLLFVAGSATMYWIARTPVGVHGKLYIAVHLALTAIMAATLFTSREDTRGLHLWTLGSGLLARVLLFDVPAFTTTDVTRYLWDGKVALAGLDPYSLMPQVVSLDRADGFPLPANGQDIVTIYPPGAIGLFALSDLWGASPAFWIWKILVTIASLATVLLIWAVLVKKKRERLVPLIALSPILVLESGVGAHVDAVSGALLAAALYFLAQKRFQSSGLTIGLGALVKFIPLAALIPITFSFPRERSKITWAAIGTLALGYAVALGLGLKPLGCLFVFFGKWHFGSPFVSALGAMLGREVGKLIAPMLALGMIWLVLRPNVTDESTLPWWIALPLLGSPVVFPWYLSAVLIAAAVYPSLSFQLWAASLPLTYEVIDLFDVTGKWRTATWPIWFVGVALATGFFLEYRNRRRRSLTLTIKEPKDSPVEEMGNDGRDGCPAPIV